MTPQEPKPRITQSLELLIEARDRAMDKVRAWWDAELLAGRYRNHTQAPAWTEYLAAFAALDERAAAQEPKP
jgi:predicted ATPase